LNFRDVLEGDGFASIPGALSKTEVDQLSERINACHARRSRAGLRHVLSLTPVASLAKQATIMELARSVLGPETFPFRATLFDKSPHSNWLVVWHQDTALPLRQRLEVPGWGPWSRKEDIAYAHAPTQALSQVLALRIHLDDSTALNGPLRVLPSTHTLGVLEDEEVHQLATQLTPVECLIPTGGILAMRPLLIHSSSKSRSEADRRVLHIEYAASPSIAAPLELAIA
jgi:ectoine hydroxylase-related dioxygenase (phytanoyl-CoA dioxygenase family)